ncbi:glycosyltransferase family 2 protein [Mongoliimonas terrestris]|uniref:glycosyltransferase family 2 protein n=1 Tax=Mongoliimonas terrestris TaxID=1709001 RepID=UPI000949A388|nr:glycosyltransferase [Mongoliimonas terrestris]
MKLAVVIPAFNRADTIGPLIEELLNASFVAEVVVVDDASTDGTADTAAAAAGRDPRVTVIRQSENRGAGAARNRGMLSVTAPYTLFLDADDRIVAPTLEAAIGHLDQFGGDFLLFRYSVFTHSPDETFAMGAGDAEIWTKEMGSRMLVGFEGTDGAGFLGLVNFPWNKIHRTTAARRYGLRFSETRVQNDVFAHWQSFMEAERFLAFNQVGVRYRASDGGERLTNRKGRERFDVFTALDEVDRLFEGRPDRDAYYPAYSSFRVGFLGWVHKQIPDDLVPEFQARAAAAFAAFDGDRFAACRRVHPAMANACVHARLAPTLLWPSR